MSKKILYLDMDGVLADFTKGADLWFERHPHLKERWKDNPDHIHGIFRDLPLISGAYQAVTALHASGKYDMFVATSCPWGNPASGMDKRYWLEKYFGDMFHKRLFTTHRKDLLIGDILIDDRVKNGAGEFKGRHIHFGWDYENQRWNEYPSWNSVLKELL